MKKLLFILLTFLSVSIHISGQTFKIDKNISGRKEFGEIRLDAGDDITITTLDSILLSATTRNIDSLVWRTSGTGTITDSTDATTYYTPSFADELKDSVVLTLLGFTMSGKDTVYDTKVITVNTVHPPLANLSGYWKDDYGIETDSTIILRDSTWTAVDTVDLIGLDWPIANGYIPLKTAALMDWIGTPTIDTAFWNYTIPPCVVFQNVDFDSTTYFKIDNHTINSDSTELLPARLTEIALYSTATDAVDYFDVPTFTNPIWIDPNSGNDATGDGTRAAPFKTVIGVEAKSSLGAGRDILVMSGKETAVNYFGATDPYDWTAIGRYNLIAGSSNAILILGNNVHISNFLLTGNSLTYVNQAQTNLTGTILSNIYCSGGTYFIRDLSAGITLNKCVSTNTNFYRNNHASNTIVINECYHSATGGGFYADATVATANKTTITYCEDEGSGIIMNGSGMYKLKFNVAKNFLTVTNGEYSGNITIKGNTLFPTITSGKLLGTPNGSTVDYNWIVQNNKVTFATGTGGTFFIAVDQKNILIENNIVDGSDTDVDFGFIHINNPTVVNVSDTIRNNYFSRYHISDAAVIQIGNETYGAGDGYLNGTYIYGNRLLGSGYYQDSPGGSHSVFITRTINTQVVDNFIEGFGIGVVFKSTTQADSSGGAFYNIIKDCRGGLLAKGYDSTKFYGNTVLITKSYEGANYGIGLILNTAADSSSDGCDVKNNIIYDISDANELALCILIDSLDNTIDYNVIYSLHNSISGIEAEWPDWKLLGFDAHSFNVTPNFTSLTQWWPVTQFNGANLGASHNTGLDITTTWGSATAIPSIITKQQGSTWQIGAYIK